VYFESENSFGNCNDDF